MQASRSNDGRNPLTVPASEALRVGESGALEVPAELVRELGFAPGEPVVLGRDGGRVTLAAPSDGARRSERQFVRWRALSRRVLAERGPGSA